MKTYQKFIFIFSLPLFWPIALFSYFLKQMNNFNLTIFTVGLIGIVMAFTIIFQLWWLRLLHLFGV